DLDTVEKSLFKSQKTGKAGDKTAQEMVHVLEKIKQHLNQGKMVHGMQLTENETQLIRPLFLLTSKPTLYIANVNEDGFENNPYLDQVKKLAEQEGNQVVPICAATEADLAELSDTEKQEFLQAMGLNESGLDRVIHAGYALLGLDTYFTAGVKEVRAWTIHRGDTAPKAAGVIHTDFEKGFIRAEVISYEDF